MSTFQASQAVHGSNVQPGHVLPDLRVLSYDPHDLPDPKSERGIVEVLNLHFE